MAGKRVASSTAGRPAKKLRLSPESDNEYAEATSPASPVKPVEEHEEDSGKPTPKSKSNSKANKTAPRPKNSVCDWEGCGRAFDRPRKLEIHRLTHTGEKPFPCTEEGCDKSFRKKEHRTIHVRDAHGRGDKTVCEHTLVDSAGNRSKCGKEFTNPGKFRRHMEMHEEKKSLTCPVPDCGQVFRKQKTLDNHVSKDHEGENPHRCTQIVIEDDGAEHECEKEFSSGSALDNHIKREHYGYACNICRQQEDEDDGMSSVMDAGTPEVNRGLDSIKDTGLSILPEFRFPDDNLMTYAELKRHIAKAHPPLCPDCGKQCKSIRGLKSHRRKEHSGLDPMVARRPHSCEQCGKRFEFGSTLKTHIRTVHEKVRKFKCGEFDMSKNEKLAAWNGVGCGEGFATKSSLERHILSIHLGVPQKAMSTKGRTKIKQEEGANGGDSLSTVTDAMEIATPGEEDGGHGLAMLTGHGYDQVRKIACLEPDCQIRFTRDMDLAYHMEMTHNWQIDDVNETMLERDALEGGDFWIGGVDPAVDERRRREESARAQMETRLRIGLEGVGGMYFDGGHEKTPGEPVVADEDEMVIDPSLES